MNNTYNDIKKGIEEAMVILSLDRMPTVQELRMLDKRKLEQAISANGGFIAWAKELNIAHKNIRMKWSDELIEQEILKIVSALGIDRMPCSTEIKSETQNDALHNKISKTGGYRYWAERLKLDIKDSETKLGQDTEDIATDLLINKGFKVERMTTKHPFDLLVNDSIKIDVKAGRAYDLRGSRCHTFGINKVHASCDIYFIFALSEQGVLERTFIIPSNKLKVSTLSLGAKTMYDCYKDRWDYINVYDKFYKSIV